MKRFAIAALAAMLAVAPASAQETIKWLHLTTNPAELAMMEDQVVSFAHEAPALVDGLGVLPEQGLDLKDHLADIEVGLIRQALDVTGGVVAHAARLLHMQRTTLVEKLRKYGLQGSMAA